MNSESRVVHRAVWGFLLVVVLSIVGVFVGTSLRPQAPPLPIYDALPDFRLTNQLGQAVSLADLRGQVWIADIIFTSCPGPCLEMTRKMRTLQSQLPSNSPVKLVSLTADPAVDTPAALKKYAARFNADSTNWHFLTGPKPAVYGLAMKGLRLAVQENTDGKPDEDQFIHSTRFVLVDRQGRLRGVGVDGTEAQAVPAILRAIRQLLKEN